MSECIWCAFLLLLLILCLCRRFTHPTIPFVSVSISLSLLFFLALRCFFSYFPSINTFHVIILDKILCENNRIMLYSKVRAGGLGKGHTRTHASSSLYTYHWLLFCKYYDTVGCYWVPLPAAGIIFYATCVSMCDCVQLCIDPYTSSSEYN